MRLFKRNEISNAVTATVLATTDTVIDFKDNKIGGNAFAQDINGADEKTTFVLVNSDAAAINVTVTPGDGAKAPNPLVLSAPVGLSYFTLDSGYYTGTAKSFKIKAATAAKVSLYVVILP